MRPGLVPQQTPCGCDPQSARVLSDRHAVSPRAAGSGLQGSLRSSSGATTPAERPPQPGKPLESKLAPPQGLFSSRDCALYRCRAEGRPVMGRFHTRDTGDRAEAKRTYAQTLNPTTLSTQHPSSNFFSTFKKCKFNFSPNGQNSGVTTSPFLKTFSHQPQLLFSSHGLSPLP